MLSKEYINTHEEELREKIAEIAKKWVGAKYHHLGMVQYKDADCMTLLLQVYEEAGLIEHREPDYYPPDFLFHRGSEEYLEGVSEYGYKSKLYKKGNILLYKFGRVISHSAIIIDYPTIIHAVADNGIIFDNANQDYLKKAERFNFSLWKE